MTSVFNVGPIAPYRNMPIEPQNFQPRSNTITAIAKGVQTLVTTERNVDYVVGQQVRFLIPPVAKMRQLNNQSAFVVAIPNPNQILVNINSVKFDAFEAQMSYQYNTPQVIPIGDANIGLLNPLGRVANTLTIPGSFQNISR